jgi:hypothetical protein
MEAVCAREGSSMKARRNEEVTHWVTIPVEAPSCPWGHSAPQSADTGMYAEVNHTVGVGRKRTGRIRNFGANNFCFWRGGGGACAAADATMACERATSARQRPMLQNAIRNQRGVPAHTTSTPRRGPRPAACTARRICAHALRAPNPRFLQMNVRRRRRAWRAWRGANARAMNQFALCTTTPHSSTPT